MNKKLTQQANHNKREYISKIGDSKELFGYIATRK